MIFQTSMITFHVNLQGCRISGCVLPNSETRTAFPPGEKWSFSWEGVFLVDEWSGISSLCTRLLRKMEVVTSWKTIVTWIPLKSYITHEHEIKVEVCWSKTWFPCFSWGNHANQILLLEKKCGPKWSHISNDSPPESPCIDFPSVWVASLSREKQDIQKHCGSTWLSIPGWFPHRLDWA